MAPGVTSRHGGYSQGLYANPGGTPERVLAYRPSVDCHAGEGDHQIGLLLVPLLLVNPLAPLLGLACYLGIGQADEFFIDERVAMPAIDLETNECSILEEHIVSG